MKSSKLVFLAVLCGSLAFAGCKSGGGDEAAAPAAEGSAAAEAPAAEAPAAEAPAAEAPAAEAAAPAEGSGAPAVAEGSGAGSQPTAQLPTSDFVATAEALHGTWNADFQAMLASQQMSEEERAMATAMLGSAQMALTFNADGTMVMNGVMMGQTQTENGTWAFVSADANKLSISATTAKEGSEPQTQAMTVAFVNGTACVITDGNEGSQAIPFNKAQ
ncbi:MAG: hypothetical protein H6699_08150 [Myxococcales bacterium]|nr:hypothetical protein [Myxococcales bacterium]